jgi:hypothetical protein
VSTDPAASDRQRVVEVRLSPRNDKSYSFAVQEVISPVAQSSERQQQYWKNVESGASPYDGAVVIDGKTNVIRRVAKNAGAGKLDVYICKSGTEDAKTELEASCTKFVEGVKRL